MTSDKYVPYTWYNQLTWKVTAENRPMHTYWLTLQNTASAHESKMKNCKKYHRKKKRISDRYNHLLSLERPVLWDPYILLSDNRHIGVLWVSCTEQSAEASPKRMSVFSFSFQSWQVNIVVHHTWKLVYARNIQNRKRFFLNDNTYNSSGGVCII